MSDFQNTVMVTLAILTGSFFSYLLQFFLGRNLSVTDFGTFNALLAIGAVTSVPASVIGTALIKQVSGLYAKNDKIKISALFYQSVIWSTALGLIIFGFFTIFKSSVFNYLKVSDSELIFSFILYISLTFVTNIPFFYLQGLLQYKVFSILVVTMNVLRFSLAMLLLVSSRTVSGVYTGLVIALVISFLFGLYLLRRHLLQVADITAWKELINIVKFSLPVMAVNLCLISFNNSDLILVRSNLGAEIAGYYAGVVTVGKILLFGTLPVATVMYPKIAALKSGGENYKRVFSKFMKMQLGVVGIGVLVFALFPRLISLAFFGHKYLESVKYLPFYAMFVALYVMLNFLVLFLLAVDLTKIYYALIILAFSQIMLLTRFHTNLYQVISMNFLILLIAVGYTAYTAYKYMKDQ